MTRSLVALVIGNGAYKRTKTLENPVHDAEDMTKALQNCGFTVDTVSDAKAEKMDRALDRFKGDLKDQDVGLFFFAGHGLQIEGNNYLLGTDARITDAIAIKHSALALNEVIDILEASDTSTNIVILDACRDNPFSPAMRSLADRGLAPVYAPRGTLIAFATSPGEQAKDGKGRNGAYTKALLEHLETPDLSIEAMFKKVRNSLSAETNGKQTSWEHTSLASDFYFNLSVAQRVTQYSPSALHDELFELDPDDNVHAVIRGLKSNSYDPQNSAVRSLTPKKIGKADLDTLFVTGRNIYQAATGNSHAAMEFIDQFLAKTSGVEVDLRTAILDGILFEIFFDKHGIIRDEPKLRKFSSAFDLQRFASLQPSFDFIAGCLSPDMARYYALPGKGHRVDADVRLGTAGKDAIEGVFVASQQILRIDDEDEWADGDITYRMWTKEQFETWLSEELLVPSRLLSITYNQPVPKNGFFRFPMGRTCRPAP
jgi:uncharacterized caspase-like protein